ncbi:MAG: tetratricopeptide repeat protein [Anaerolineae bacterium]
MQTKLSLFCETIIEAGWLLALAVVPLFFNVYSNRVFEPDKLTLLRSIALIMALAWLIKTVEESKASDTRHPILCNPLTVPVLLLVSIYLISTAFSIFPRVSIWGSYQRLQGSYTTLSYIVIFFLTWGTLRTREQLNRLITTVLITSLPISLYGILQHYKLDPLPWGGDVTERVASTMGNSIFLAAYLIMVVPLTVARIIETTSDVLKAEGERVLHWSLVGVYVLLLSAQLTAILFTKSRGPFLGLLVGLFVFTFLFGLTRKVTWLWGSAVALAITGITFLILFNLPTTPLAPLRDAPYIGRLGRVFETGASGKDRTGRVRLLIWEGVIGLLTSDPARAVIGYGPESMYVAYNKHYPPDLAHVEARNASPDRSHNETFDALVTTGVIGLAAYLLLFGAIFYYGFQWLGLVKGLGQRQLLIGLWVAGGALGALVPWLLEGTFRFAGVGFPLGIVLATVAYLMPAGFFLSKGGQRPSLNTYKLLIIGLLSAVIAHFVEIHFGIAISATRTYFWLYTAVLAVVGYRFLPRGAERTQPIPEQAEPVPRAEPRDEAPRRQGSTSVRRRGIQKELAATTFWHPALTASTLLVTMILITLAYDFVTPQFDIQAKNYSILGLFVTVWFLANLIVVGEFSKDHLSSHGKRGGLWDFPICSLLSLTWFLLFVFGYSHRIRPRAGLDLLTSINIVANNVVVYYATLFITLLLMAVILWRGSMVSAPLWRWARTPRQALRAFGRVLPVALYGGLLAVVLILVLVTNVNTVRADVYYKQGLSLDESQQWDYSIAMYQRALELSPDQDHYYLFLGRALMEKAKFARNPDHRSTWFEGSRQALEKARELAPLNTDHTANLARLYQTWAVFTPDPQKRETRHQKAIHYYRQATTLSPHNALLFNEWGTVYHSQGQYDKALERYHQSLALDKEFTQTYRLIGDAYLAQEEWDKATEAYQQVVALSSAWLEQRDRNQLGQAFPIDQNAVLAHKALAFINSKQGKWAEAVNEYLAVLELVPDDLVSHHNLALLYRQLGDLDQAMAHAEIALEVAPEEERLALQSLLALLGVVKE